MDPVPSNTLFGEFEETKKAPTHAPQIDITKLIQNGGKKQTPAEAYAARHTPDFSTILDPNRPLPARQPLDQKKTTEEIKKVKDNFATLPSIPKIPKKQ